MHEGPFIARLFLVTGVILAIAGLVLWKALPIASASPPYAITAALALIYGAAFRWGRFGGASKP